MSADHRLLGRIAAGLTVAAFAWAVFLVVRVAAYDGYIDEYGYGMLAAHAIPAALVGLAWLALRHACTTGSWAARRTGATLAGLLLAFSILGGFSIGFLSHYSALLLIAAVAITPLGGGATGARCDLRG